MVHTHITAHCFLRALKRNGLPSRSQLQYHHFRERKRGQGVLRINIRELVFLGSYMHNILATYIVAECASFPVSFPCTAARLQYGVTIDAIYGVTKEKL